MRKIAYQIYLLSGLKFAENALVVCLIAFFDFLQAQFAISFSERRQWLFYVIGLGILIFRLCREIVKFDQQRIERDIKKEELKKLKQDSLS